MPRLLGRVQAFLDRRRDEVGATAVEYALIVGLITVVIVGAVTMVGGKLGATFSSIASAFQ